MKFRPCTLLYVCVVRAGGGGRTKNNTKKKGNDVAGQHWKLSEVGVGILKRTCKHCMDQSYVGKTKNATRLANHSLGCSQVRWSALLSADSSL